MDFSIEYASQSEISANPVVRLDRSPLTVWAEHTGIPVDFWRSLDITEEGDRYIAFNWPAQGWKKVRNVLLRVDAVTRTDKVVRRFQWVSPPPGKMHPLWPQPSEGKHEEIWLCEGESDAAVLRYAGFDAYTFGAATCIPGDVELRLLDYLGVRRCVLVYDADAPGRTATAKVGEAISGYESGEPFDVVPIDLGPTLKRWQYKKDVRDLFGQVTLEEFRQCLVGLKEGLLADREEDISAAVVLDKASDPAWVIDGLFAARGLNMLYGAPKQGKTTLTFHAIKAMGGEDGTGDSEDEENWVKLLSRPVKPQRVLYYSEMPDSFDKSAVEIVFPEGPPANLWLRHSSDKLFTAMAWPQIVMQIERDVDKYGITYVVVDTVIEWFKFNSEEMYDAAAVGKKLSLLRRLTSRGITVQINHHPPKAGGSPFGSVAFQGYVDCLVEMERDKDGTTLTSIGRLRSDFNSVKYAFADDQGTELAVLKVDDRKDRVSEETQNALVSGIKARIIALLPYSPGSKTVAELRQDDFLENAGKQIRTRLAELVRAGLVGQDDDKYWRIFGITVKEKDA